MDNFSSPTINNVTSYNSSLFTSSASNKIILDRQTEKQIRHKLFLLSCDKLAALRHTSNGNALRRNLHILGVCRRTKSIESYPVDECASLLSERDKDTVRGPLYARRSNVSTVNTPVVSTPIATPTKTISPTQATVTDGFIFNNNPFERTDNDIEIDFEDKSTVVPEEDDEMEIDFSHGFELEKKKNHRENIFEYQVWDTCKTSSEDMCGVEEGADALEMLMEEDGTSIARKRKSRQTRMDSEKRHCDAEIISPMSVTAPIPIPRPPKKPDQVVLDTLVPLRGFFQYR